MIEFDTPEKQLDFVTNICQQKVVYHNKHPGVNVLDHDDGRKKVRMGVRTSAEKEQDSGAGRIAETDSKDSLTVSHKVSRSAHSCGTGHLISFTDSFINSFIHESRVTSL